MNLITIVKELQAEKAVGEQMTSELVGRIDAHIRDLELLKAWIIDAGKARAMALDGLLNGEQLPAIPPMETKSE